MHRTTVIAKTSREEEESKSEEWDERSVIRLTAERVSRPRAGRREPRKRACQEVAVGASCWCGVEGGDGQRRPRRDERKKTNPERVVAW